MDDDVRLIEVTAIDDVTAGQGFSSRPQVRRSLRRGEDILGDEDPVRSRVHYEGSHRRTADRKVHRRACRRTHRTVDEGNSRAGDVGLARARIVGVKIPSGCLRGRWRAHDNRERQANAGDAGCEIQPKDRRHNASTPFLRRFFERQTTRIEPAR